MPSQSEAMRAARLFEFYTKYLWPVHRILVRSKIAARCQKCAASEKMIPLAPSGLCQLCERSTHSIETQSVNSQTEKVQTEEVQNEEAQAQTQALNQILKKTTGTGNSGYDALVLFSGGKDSTYLIHRIQEENPALRMLSFTIDNGFMSPVAKENIAELIPKLGIDHIFVTPQKKFYVKLFRYTITHLNSEGGSGTVDFSDGEFMLDTARRIAAEKQIPLILCGYSKYQVQNGLKLKTFESPSSRERADRVHTAGLALAEIFSPEEIKRWWHGSQWPEQHVARLLFPLYAWDLEEAEIKQKVTSWGLVSKKSYSPIVTNHQLIPLLGVVDVQKMGYSSFEIEFCRMIREGKARRSEWQSVFELLEYTSKTGLFVKPTVEKSLSDLNLTLEDVGIKFTSECTNKRGIQ
jgi:3'-phosphoadenosine 5'-phosphosulfate sulfotransferase (PAPS reductase)/FAD synthetase